MIAATIASTQAVMQSAVQTIGEEGETVVTVDGFADDCDALRDAALGASFSPAGEHYPGIRAPLPEGYFARQLPSIARALGRRFGRLRRIRVVDASFSVVTADPSALTIGQRLPHVDAYGAERIALVHYLSPVDRDGTAFFRHRSSGFETIDATRAPIYFELLERELAQSDAVPSGYIAGSSDLFERIGHVDARYNRAVLYHSYQLHSGAIAPDAILSADPAIGRLTITAFLALE